MPKQKSFIIKIKGFIKGVSYYFEKGEPRERIPNPPTKDQEIKPLGTLSAGKNLLSI